VSYAAAFDEDHRFARDLARGGVEECVGVDSSNHEGMLARDEGLAETAEFG
jgi:hypothetical protein